jgi:hypothetical protein
VTEQLILQEQEAEQLIARDSRHAIGIRSAQMKKEVLKGFSLLALIIMLALMTAVASVSANAPSSEDQSPAAVSR